jgi:hypothetical protein
VAHAAKGGDGEKEEDFDAAAALPRACSALSSVGAPSVYCCGGERSVYCYGGAEESKGGDGEEEKDGDVAAALPHAVAPVGAQSAAAAGLYGEWRGYSNSSCCAEQRSLRRDQVTRRNSVAKRATFDNWRLAAEQGSQLAWSETTDVVS